ncbi:hypothetical protein EYW49_11425 [Siculibacillus lacustris]|uniref:DUF3299 domain-containing protein n=1 Tax=Siculibacillus lacustris TaxID=1549641 RepID=A0A4Q9VP44_9HYPH|nr:hypothetical protein [Siculibacillus lacustris]TBW37366.1 hypothetical protein EYW49_11425 [Siculibacillus lacustris]
MPHPTRGSADRLLTRRHFAAACLAVPLAAFLRPGRAAAEDPVVLTFEQLYASFGVRGLTFSPLVLGAAGRPVSLTGYMAPPLQAEATFFVLTREPMAICPFCQSDADWPVDIVVVTLAAATPLVSAGTRVTVSGRLEVGSKTDPTTGFVSQMRIVDADFRRTR